MKQKEIKQSRGGSKVARMHGPGETRVATSMSNPSLERLLHVPSPKEDSPLA